MKPLFLICLISLAGLPLLHAQIAEYNFENNIRDEVDKLDPSYLLLGSATKTVATYVDNTDFSSIRLAPQNGLLFPQKIADQVDENASFEIDLTFSVEDLGNGRGDKFLWSSQDSHGSEGMGIFVSTGEDTPDGTYNVYMSYSDGLSRGIPYPFKYSQSVLGRLSVGETARLRFLVDFKNKTWHSLIGDRYESQAFDTQNFEWSEIVIGIKEEPWHVGWAKSLGNDRTLNKNFSSTISIDHLAIYSPGRDAFTSTTPSYDKTSNFSISPTLSRGLIKISSDISTYDVQVHDIQGRVHLDKNALSKNSSLDLGSFSNGLYIVNIQDNTSGDFHHFKIILSR